MEPNSSTTDASLPIHLNTSSRRTRSLVWEHFTKSLDEDHKAACNYCGILIKYSAGTSAMKSHLMRCDANPDKRPKRKKLNSSSSQTVEGQVSGGVRSSPNYFKFDQETCQKELVKMFVIVELPFRFVENESFDKFLSVLQPRFSVPSRSTLTRHIFVLFNEEREKLKKFLSKHCGRVCLTTDTWTSVQNLTYMSLTGHFVDNDWRLQKKILNFRQIMGHSGEVIAKNVEICLNEWELNRVFSLTVDNASSNDLGIQYLKKRLMSWHSVLLKGEYIHMRCCAHILCLIVKDGLKGVDDSILRIRGAVKYIRSSPSRLARFKACAEQEKITYKGLVCLDVETRWNSTYLMLDAALKYQKAFDLLEMQDNKYVEDLLKGKGVPSQSDWDDARLLLPFLKMFYDATIRISGSYYVTSNIYMKEVFAIGRKIRKFQENNDVFIRSMATRMRTKYDKYWGRANGINILLLIAVVLDPRCKLEYVNHFIDYLFDNDQAQELKLKLSSNLRSLYEQYQGIEEGSQSNQQVQLDDDDDDIHGMSFYLQTTGRRFDSKSELDKYLMEDCEPFIKSVEFDILNWWKVNTARFPILGSIAREVLAIPISTVASESSFSTGGRVLDPYRSSFTPRMVEALVCTQDWLKGTSFSMFTNEDFEELEKLEEEILSPQEGTSLNAINLDD